MLPAIQQMMTSFGAKYKKKEACVQNQRLFEVVTAPVPKKAMEDFFSAVCLSRLGDKLLDINSEVPGFKDTVWQVGYAPTFSSTALAPNACGMCRVFAMGSLTVIMVDIGRVVRAAESLGRKLNKLSEVKDFVRGLTLAEYRKVKDAGCPFITVRQVEEMMLFVPTGWLLCEFASNDPLIYGFRKSFFLDTAVEHKAYELNAHLMEGDSLQVDKMRQVSKLFSCASAGVESEGVAAAAPSA